MDYKTAGVDIEAGYKSVELMKEHVKRTMREEVLGGLGGFSGAFSLAKIKEMEEPVLLSGTDGCGTKVKLAMVMDKHDTIGIDAVAMCVNDIACAGGEPLFFLDYIACGKNYPEKIAAIVGGVAEGCVQSDAALIGGETAEHPGLMPEDEYDLAGFAVGVCDKKEMITGEELKAGDVLIGMASTGVHSNGFSLVRKVFDMTKESLDTYYEELGTTLGEALLAPTRIYVISIVHHLFINIAFFSKKFEDWKYRIAVLFHNCTCSLFKHTRNIFIKTAACDMTACVHTNSGIFNAL